MAANIQALLTEYVRCAHRHAATDYGVRTSVRTANRAADRMRKIARTLAEQTDAEASYRQLLANPVAGIWAAHHALEILGAGGALKTQALEIIRARAKGKTPDAIGERIWLEDFERSNA